MTFAKHEPMAQVTVIDYGIGNLFSVRRALESVGADVEVVNNVAGIDRAQRLILPGVGAFANGMAGIRQYGLEQRLREFAASGRPLLGICLGMQMLLSHSEEFGEHEGLDIIPGWVRRIPSASVHGVPHRIPHVGWSRLQMPASRRSWKGSLLGDFEPGVEVYLVHSYVAVPADPGHCLADCSYSGHTLTAAVTAGNVVGFQFHPEKSGRAGLQMLKRFASL